MNVKDLAKAQELVDEYTKFARMYIHIPQHVILVYPGDERFGFELDLDDKRAIYELLIKKINRIRARLDLLGVKVEYELGVEIE